jgi:predicted regulator of Ras-like GTPase activity (Roadblock/LC7/MglB family)
MVKKTQSMHETATTVVIEHGTPTAVEEDQTFTSLRANLAEINKLKEVTGYILKNATTAIIDLKNHARLTEYAILASQTLDSAQEISELFTLGTIENILIKGKDTKMLCVATGENKIAIFMEKNADHADILKRL